MELCKRAVGENIIVHIRTGGGKTHIAVLLMHEFAHRIKKPSKEVCIFLAPTSPLVRQVQIRFSPFPRLTVSSAIFQFSVSLTALNGFQAGVHKLAP